MKRYLLIVLIFLFVCGCNKDQKKYQIDNLKFLDDNFIKGTITSNTSDNCNTIQINISLLNDNNYSIYSTWFTTNPPKKGKKITFEEPVVIDVTLDDINQYDIKIDGVECWN